MSPRDQSGAKSRRNTLLASQRRRVSLPAGLERLEGRTLLAVSIINGGGLGYVGNGAPAARGPPDVTGMAGPKSYLEITNDTVTLFSPKPGGTILAQHGISDFFYNPAIGNQTQIDLPSPANSSRLPPARPAPPSQALP